MDEHNTLRDIHIPTPPQTQISIWPTSTSIHLHKNTTGKGILETPQRIQTAEAEILRGAWLKW
jgi:hypothetical protein